MAHTFEELKHMNVSQLREVAKEEEIKGYTQINKEHLLEAVCEKLNLDMHVHHHVEGVDKVSIKAKIKKLKAVRNKFIEEKNKKELKHTRREIKKLKNKLRKSLV